MNRKYTSILLSVAILLFGQISAKALDRDIDMLVQKNLFTKRMGFRSCIVHGITRAEVCYFQELICGNIAMLKDCFAENIKVNANVSEIYLNNTTVLGDIQFETEGTVYCYRSTIRGQVINGTVVLLDCWIAQEFAKLNEALEKKFVPSNAAELANWQSLWGQVEDVDIAEDVELTKQSFGQFMARGKLTAKFCDFEGLACADQPVYLENCIVTNGILAFGSDEDGAEPTKIYLIESRIRGDINFHNGKGIVYAKDSILYGQVIGGEIIRSK